MPNTRDTQITTHVTKGALRANTPLTESEEKGRLLAVYKRVFNWHRGDLRPERVQSGSLLWLYICLHDTTTNFMLARVTQAWVHRGSCAGAIISLRYEISQQFHVNTKRPPVSVFRLTWTGSVCIIFAILNHKCILSTWIVPSNNEMWNDSVIM